MLRTWWRLLLLLLLTACGGGGGSDGARLSFAPSKIEMTYESGTSAEINLQATISNTQDINGNVFIYIEDTNSVLAGEVNIYGIDQNTYAITVHTSPALIHGKHEGKLMVHLCKDINCRSEYGSPSALPYSIMVNPALLSATLSTPANIDYVIGNSTPDNARLLVKVDDQTWSVSSSSSWLTPLTQSGTGNGSLEIAINPANLGIGPHSGTLTVTTADNQTASVTLTLQVSQRNLLPSQWGIGLTSSSTSRLSASIDISIDSGSPVDWIAESDTPWLQVTTAGNTSNSHTLNLQASPASLPDNQISYANITISSTEPGVGSAQVRVALWKGSSSAQTSINANYSHILADPIRPLIYVTSDSDFVDIYNVHTGQKVGSITGMGPMAQEMGISPDGSKLYVVESSSGKILVADLDTQTFSTSWPLTNRAYYSTKILAIRPHGTEVVLVNDGTVYKDGHLVGTTTIRGSMVASKDFLKIYTQERGYSPSALTTYNIEYSEKSGGIFTATEIARTYSGDNGTDLAIGPMGIISASGAPYTCQLFDPATLTSLGNLFQDSQPYPNNAEVTSTGSTICGISGWYSTYDFWVYGANGSQTGAYKIAGYAKQILDSGLTTSADGIMAAVLTSDPKLVFISIAN